MQKWLKFMFIVHTNVEINILETHLYILSNNDLWDIIREPQKA